MKKILIIDDSPALLELYEYNLKAAGFVAEKAEDGKEGLQKTKEGKPDLVILDLLMPGKDGFDYLREKNGDEEIKNIPVVVLTNLDGKEDIEKARELGAIGYCVKYQNTAEEMVKKIKKYFKKK